MLSSGCVEFNRCEKKTTQLDSALRKLRSGMDNKEDDWKLITSGKQVYSLKATEEASQEVLSLQAVPINEEWVLIARGFNNYQSIDNVQNKSEARDSALFISLRTRKVTHLADVRNCSHYCCNYSDYPYNRLKILLYSSLAWTVNLQSCT